MFLDGYGAFVARATLTPRKAAALAAAGHGFVALQVEFQGSELRQKTPAELAAETAAAAAAGLGHLWWAWVRPGQRAGAGRRPGGPAALQRRLAELLDAGVPAPAWFIADAEVGGGWSPSRPDLAPIAAAARAAGIPLVALSTHATVGPRWPVSAFDAGMPQLYRRAAVTAPWAARCLRSWRGCSTFWPTLGAADDYSTADAMAADLRALAELGAGGAWWWTARQLSGAKLAASVPGDQT